MRLIDADSLINDREFFIVIGAGDNICIDIADIAKAPTIEAKPVKHGRWKLDLSPYDHTWAYKCTACNGFVNDKTSYCPNCGAKMDGERCGKKLKKAQQYI